MNKKELTVGGKFARLVVTVAVAKALSLPEAAPPTMVDLSPPQRTLPEEVIFSAPTASPTPQPTLEPSPTITPTPEPTINYLAMNKVIGEMKARPDLFSQRKIEDVKMYYPIYAAVGQAYDVDWEILWIIHERESTASTNPDAFNGRSAPYYGAVQRSNVWSDEYADEAVDEKNLEWLQYLPQRHPDDYRELAFAGRFLYEHRLKYMNKGYKKDTAFLIALGNFNNPQSGLDRYNEDKFLKKEVFKD